MNSSYVYVIETRGFWDNQRALKAVAGYYHVWKVPTYDEWETGTPRIYKVNLTFDEVFKFVNSKKLKHEVRMPMDLEQEIEDLQYKLDKIED